MNGLRIFAIAFGLIWSAFGAGLLFWAKAWQQDLERADHFLGPRGEASRLFGRFLRDPNTRLGLRFLGAIVLALGLGFLYVIAIKQVPIG